MPGEEDKVVKYNIVTEMRESYLDYAMSVITARALPDVRDGLKPVHRRVLYTMHEMGLNHSGRFRKSSAIVGDTMGKFHPHGDSAIYDSLAKLAQDFTTRYPLVMGQGNFGSIDGDSPAAMRYTEAKMSRVAGELLRDIDKDTVEWRPNYDSTKKEPIVLPAALPNLLLNGTLGIAVGMATNIPPHNLGEVVDATVHLIDAPDATTDDLMEFVKGPDFPLGGVVFNKADIHHAYATGRGGVVVRGEAEIVEDKKGAFSIIISSIPYRVNKSDLIVKIADLVREKRLEGIRDLRDESTKDIRVVVELKSGAQPQKVLNALYKHTQLEDTFHYNVVALVDGIPQTMSLKGMLEAFIKHREEVVERRTRFELKKAEDREHILLGLSKALDHIDEIIALIKKSKDVPEAHAALIKKFAFSERQATAILEMRLSKLAGLERKKIEDELLEIQKIIKELKRILSTRANILAVIKGELAEIRERYADPRRTKVMKGAVTQISVEDLVPEESTVLVLTQGGYVKRTNPDEYKNQKRGGVGVIDLNTKEEDFVTTFLTASTHDDLLFFTDRGRAYQIKMYDIPEGKRATKGKAIVNFLPLQDTERVTSVLARPKAAKVSPSLVLLTRQGVVKRVSAQSFADVRRSGIIAINLQAGDSLTSVHLACEGDSFIMVTSQGQSIRFPLADVREMGRTAGGVKAMKLVKNDEIIGASVILENDETSKLLVVAENGYGKKTSVNEYKIQGRGGSGIKTAQVTAKTGKIMAAQVVSIQEEVIVVSKNGQVIRTTLTEVPTLGRQTQGVRIMKMREGDSIASLVCL